MSRPWQVRKALVPSFTWLVGIRFSSGPGLTERHGAVIGGKRLRGPGRDSGAPKYLTQGLRSAGENGTDKLSNISDNYGSGGVKESS